MPAKKMPKQETTPTDATKETSTKKQTKSTKTTDTSPVTTTPVAETTPPVKTTKSSKTKTVEVEPVTTDNVVVDTPKGVTEDFAELLTKIQKIVTEFSQLKTELKTLEKKTTKELKVVTKMQNKRKKKQGVRAPSGFVKPTKISDELAVFLEKPSGTEMARTEVTREINAYIRANQLQDKNNGRKINPDKKLASLLKVTAADELTYFNLQRYMSPHFTKNTPVVTTSA